MLKRSYLSVVRRKTKSIVMFLFLFVISTLALCSISIKNASNESINLVKKALGGEVTLSADMSKLRENFMGENKMQEGQPPSNEDRKSQMNDMHNKMQESNATIDDVNKISSIKYVSDVKYTFNVTATESSFELYETQSSEDEENMRMPKGRDMNSLQVISINTFDLDDNYKNKKIELVDGTSFDEDDVDVAIISYELATNNDLNINDEIKLKDSNDEEHSLKIIGIYQNKDSDEFNNKYNKIYTDINSGEKFLSEESYNNGNYKISSAVFYLNDPEKTDEFKKEANKVVTDLEDRYLKLDIDTESYDRMVSSIEGTKNFSNIILVVVILSSIIVISLMIINSVKDRNYEIGVLLSLGEKKIKIVLQFILELVLISILSFIISIGTSKLISQKLADKVISIQTSSKENAQEFNGRGNGFSNREHLGNMGDNNVEIVDEIDVNVNSNSILMLFVLEFGIIVVSMIIPSIKILNSDPKDILSRRE